MKPLNLIYDTTVISAAKISQRSRTGIYRYTKTLLTHLGAHNLSIITYDRMNAQLTACDPQESCTATHTQKTTLSWYDRIPQWLRPATRILGNIYIAYKTYHLNHRLMKQKLTDDTVYHSPFHGIPRSLTNMTQVGKVITVHDVLPITHPHFFEQTQSTHVTQQLIDSLQPDWIIIAVSHYTKQQLMKLRPDLPPAHIVVTHLAYDPSLFYPSHDQARFSIIRHKYNLPTNQPFFLSVATLEPRKNLSALIRAFDAVADQPGLEHFNLVLAGTLGNQGNQVTQAWQAAKHRDRIITTGYVADDELATLYSNAYGFVYPSLHEGFGLPVIEAMACGTPVITGNHSSLPEVTGDAAILIDTSEPSALKDALLNLAHDRKQRDQLAEQALKQAKKFSWQHTANQTLQAYHLAHEQAQRLHHQSEPQEQP